MGQTCSYILVQPGDGCANLAARCGITSAQFTEYNPSPTLCSTLVPAQPVCCSTGSLPDLTPQPNADGTCATHTVVAGDYCWDIASKNYITVDNIEQWNLKSWGWEGCANLKPGPICISTGDPPMPAPVDGTVCGPQVHGTTRPSSWSQISSLNPCPLNACCNKWGQCGITPEFCTPSQSSTGAPGTSAPGQNGCISNCGTGIVNNGSPGGSMRIGYFEAFGVNRACLTMDASAIPSGYTHMHYAFGGLTSDYQVDLSQYATQWKRFAAMTGFKRILSFGGWSFSTNVDSYPIFRDGVTEANRLRFAQSVVDTVRQYNLDGVDFDWEYPSADIPGVPLGSPDEGPNYLAFLKTVRALLPTGVSLSIAAPASYWYLKGFPIAEMAEVLDYIVYMTYDLHGQWDYNNTWASPGCSLGNCLRSHINLTETEYALSMITKAGVPASKIAVGIAGYGRSFGMVDPGCTGPHCLFTGPESTAEQGPCTGTAGYISQAELDSLVSGGAATSGLARRGAVTTWYDSSSDSDMITYGGGTWVSYMSHATKASRINRYASYGFAGSVEWAVDLVQFVLGQDEKNPGLSVAQQEAEFTEALASSNYDTSLFADYNFTDLATRLTGWDKCTGMQRRAIYSGWQQSWKLMNLMYAEANAGLDLNSAAALEYLGPPATSQYKKAQFETIFKTHATIQPGYIRTPFDWRLPVRCDDPRNTCPCGVDEDSVTHAYTWRQDPKYNGPSINFCPAYFSSPTLDSVMQYASGDHPLDVYADVSNYYPNQAKTWYHELMHVDWATGASPQGSIRHITDLLLGFYRGGGIWDYMRAYGVEHVKALARNYLGSLEVIRNSDSLTLYALTKYIQKALGNVYPHLPLAGESPNSVSGAYRVPGYFSVESDGTAKLEPGAAWQYQEDGWTAAGAGDGCSGISDVDGDRGSDNGVVTLTAGWAAESDYPASYVMSYSSWAGLYTTATAADPPAPTATWGLTVYSEPDCSGDYYSLQGYNKKTTTTQCLQLRSGLPQTSATGPSCRWFTNGGRVWGDCSAGWLTKPKSWRVRTGTCTAFSNNVCRLDSDSQAYTWAQGCHNSDGDFDTEVWTAVSCGVLDIPGDGIGEYRVGSVGAGVEVPPFNGTATTAVTPSMLTVTRTTTAHTSATGNHD